MKEAAQGQCRERRPGYRRLVHLGLDRLERIVKQSNRRFVLVGLLVLGLAGCTTLQDYVHNCFKVGPNYKRPPAPVADDWIDTADPRLSHESIDLSHWWTVLNDPVLDGLVQAAYQQNLTLREAGFRVLQARASLGIAVGNIFPQTQVANGNFTRTALSAAVANRQFIAERFYNEWNLGFGLAWEIDVWGRFRRAIEEADARLNASVEEYDSVLVTLLGDVASTYVQIRTIEQEIAYIRENVKLQRESLDIARARFQGGDTSELDVDQAQSVLSQTEATIPQQEILLRQASNRLCILLGMPPEELQAKIGPAPIPTAPPEVAVGIPAELLSRRPDIRRAERVAAAQCAAIGIAETDFYPAISINGTIGYSAEDISNLFTPLAYRGAIGPSFQWKILNYGRILNNVRLQEARFQELVVHYQNVVLRANEEVEDGLVQFIKAHQQTRYLIESVEAARKAVRVAIAQYKGGLVDYNRVALLEQNLVQQLNLLAQARGEIAQGLIVTYRALGGGWEIRCDPSASVGCFPIEPSIPGPVTQAEIMPNPTPIPTPPVKDKEATSEPKGAR